MKKKSGARKETYQTWSMRMISLCIKTLSLQEYDITVGFIKHNKNFKNGYDVFGTNTTDVRYLTSKIRLYPKHKELFNKGKYDEAFEIILHEVCHIYTEPLYERAINNYSKKSSDLIESIREQSTQRISTCVFRLIDKNKYKPLTKK